MKIHVLTENTSLKPELAAEHGLSLYIETQKHNILFDTGQSDVFLSNAEKMGVDLKKADLVILSHGHYDHGGGLMTFLKYNDHAKIYMNEHAFLPYDHGEERYIGLDTKLKDSGRLVMVGDELKLDEELSLYSCNEKELFTPIESFGLTKFENGNYLPDDFRHEQYLLIHENGKKVLISGCSHKGILNIVHWFEPDVLVGGFHFMKLDPEKPEDREKLNRAAKELLRFPIQYYSGHCTGVPQYEYLKTIMKDRLDAIHVGKVFEI